MAKVAYVHSFSTVAFENGMQYCHYDSRIFNRNILAASCARLMKIGPVAPVITRVANALFDETSKISISH